MNEVAETAPVAAPAQKRPRRSFVAQDAATQAPSPRKASDLPFDCRIEKEALAAALARVKSVVEPRSTIPITGCVKIETHGDILRLIGTDLDMYAVEKNEGRVASEPYALAVDAHRLHDVVAALPKGAEVKLTVGREENARLKVSSGRSVFSLPKLDVGDFPVDLLKKQLPTSSKIEAGALLRLLESAAHAMSTEETRYYLNGIYLHPVDVGGKQKLCAVSTDGHRLARLYTDWPEGAPSFAGVILSRKFVSRAIALLGSVSEDETVTLALSEGIVRLSFNGSSLTSKLVEGTFPDYVRVIPQANKQRATIAKPDLEAAVRRVSVMASDKGKGVKMAFKEGSLTLSCTNSEYGDSVEDIEIDYFCEPFEIGFNAAYALEMLANAGDEIEMQMDGNSCPAVIVPPGEGVESADTLFVLMPLRVN